MTGYIARLALTDRQRSSAAIWSQRLAVFAIPFFVIVILGHRYGAIDTIPALWLLGLGIGIVLAALICGGRGFFELWYYGHKGGLSATRGIVLALALLLPFIYFSVQAFLLPPLYDISTDLDDPPAFEVALDDRSDEMNPVLDPTSVTRRLQLEAYPRLAARRYPLGTGRVFRAVAELVGERDWTILTANVEPGNAPIDDEGSGLVADSVTDARGRPLRVPVPRFRPQNKPEPVPETEPQSFETVQVSPTGRDEADENSEQEERYIEAVATSFVFGFESDVIIRLVEEEDGTLVDMRSTSRWGPHDFGSNAQRILDFMSDLDTELQGLGH